MSATRVRVFVSSTFSDMHAERDCLAAFVFPELRARCAKRGVDFVGVDLRWGLTSEDIDEFGSIELCLQEIDRCHPFFLAILGDRYGYLPAPDHIPAELFTWTRDASNLRERALLERAYREDRSAQPVEFRLCIAGQERDEARRDLIRIWTTAGLPDAGLSVTEREIEHALSKTSHALIYIRESGVHQHPDFPEDWVERFSEPDKHQRRRLGDLKQRLRARSSEVLVAEYETSFAGLRVSPSLLPDTLSEEERESFADGVFQPDEWSSLGAPLKQLLEREGTIALHGIEAWGNRVVEDLWSRIDAQFGIQVTVSERQHERAHHGAYVRDRSRLFVGREEWIDRVLDFIGANDGGPPLVVTGEPGSGKSSLIARCVERAAEAHPGALIVPHFIGVAPDSRQLTDSLASICEWLRNECDIDRELPSNLDEISSEFKHFLEYAAAVRPIVLFIDALNQLDPRDQSHDLRWLPIHLSGPIRIIVTTLAGDCLDRLEEDVPPDRVLRLPDLSQAEREELVERHLELRGKKLTTTQLEKLLDSRLRPDIGRPLYLVVALDQLSRLGSFTNLDDHIEALPARLPELFQQVIAYLERDHGLAMVRGVLCWMATSRVGLLESEIVEMLDVEEESLPRVRWARLYRSLETLITGRDEDSGVGLISFHHDQFHFAVCRRYLEMDDPASPKSDSWRRYHARLADYFGAEEYDWHEAGDRSLAELPHHLAQSGAAERLDELLLDAEFLSSKLPRLGVRSLRNDMRLSMELEPPRERTPAITALAEAIRRATHILVRDPDQLPAQLAGRLEGTPDRHLQELLEELSLQRSSPWLHPRTASLDAPGSVLVQTLKNNSRTLTTVSVTHDGRFAVTGDENGLLTVWELEHGIQIHTLQIDDGYTASAAHPSRFVVAVGTSQGAVLFIDVERGRVLSTIDTTSGENLNSMFFTPNGGRLVCSCEDGMIRTYDLEAPGEPIYQIDVRGNVKRAFYKVPIAPANDGRSFFGGRSSIREWDVETGECIRKLPGSLPRVFSLAASSDGRWLAAGAEDPAVEVFHGHVHLWDLEDPHDPRMLEGDADTLGVMAFALDSKELLWSGSGERFWRMAVAHEKSPRQLHGHSGRVQGLAVHNNGNRVVSVSDDDSAILWDVSAKESDDGTTAADFGLYPHVISEELAIYASVDREADIVIMDLNQHIERRRFLVGERLGNVDVTGRRFNAMAIDERRGVVVMLRGFRGLGGFIKSWDLETGEETKRVAAQTIIDGGALAPDASLAVVPDRKRGLGLWRPTRKRRLTTVEGAFGSQVVISADSRFAAVSGVAPGNGAGHDIYIIDLGKGTNASVMHYISGDDLQEFASQLPPRDAGRLQSVGELFVTATEAMAIAREARLVITGDRSGNVFLIDLETLQVSVMGLHDWRVITIALSPDELLACSASWDGMLRLWEVESREVVASFCSDHMWQSCRFLDDYGTIVAQDTSGRVHVLDLDGGNISSVPRHHEYQ